MKITYNAWRALCFIAGAILIVFGFIADEGRGNAACLCLGCVLAAAVVCSMLTTWTSGQLGHLAYSRAARRWFPWLAFLAFCLQVSSAPCPFFTCACVCVCVGWGELFTNWHILVDFQRFSRLLLAPFWRAFCRGRNIYNVQEIGWYELEISTTDVLNVSFY